VKPIKGYEDIEIVEYLKAALNIMVLMQCIVEMIIERDVGECT
jgi:hypothetical protein